MSEIKIYQTVLTVDTMEELKSKTGQHTVRGALDEAVKFTLENKKGGK